MDTKSRLNIFFNKSQTQKTNNKELEKNKSSQPKENNVVEVIESTTKVHPLNNKISFENIQHQSLYIHFQKLISVKKILFLDVESRDLGYAPSNTPYLIGLGYFTQTNFTIKQIFLKNPVEEEKSLQVLDNLWKQFDHIVTYNGKSFDIPLIKSRYDYFIRTYPNHFIEHFDLYHIIRRISSFDRYRLIDSEKNILQLQREHDLPGSYSGQAYHEFLVWDKTELVNQIIQHNKTDIISLAALFLKINQEFISARKNKKQLWASKIYKADVKNHKQIISLLQEKKQNSSLDEEDYYYLARSHKKLKNFLYAYNYFFRSYKLGNKKSLIELITIAYFYLKKYKKALQLIDKYLPLEEAGTQEILLKKQEIIIKKLNPLTLHIHFID